MFPSGIRCEGSESALVHFKPETGTGPDQKQTNKQETSGQHPNTDLLENLSHVESLLPFYESCGLIYSVLPSLSKGQFQYGHYLLRQALSTQHLTVESSTCRTFQ